MIDQVITLSCKGHCGPIHVLSSNVGLCRTQYVQFAIISGHYMQRWCVDENQCSLKDIAPEVSNAFEKFRQEGAVKIHAEYLGFINENEVWDGSRLSTEADTKSYNVSRRLSGQSSIGHSLLLQQVKEEGLIVINRLSLGIDLHDESRLLLMQERPVEGLYAAGALTTKRFWQMMAIPDSRV